MISFLSRLYTYLIYLFLYLPILVLVVFSFNDSKYSLEWNGFTLKWYEALGDKALLWDAAKNSLTLALCSSLLCVFVASMAAVSLYRYRFFGRGFLQSTLFVMTLTPDIVMAISLLTLFTVLHLELGFTSLLLSHITFSLPFVIGTIYSRLMGFNKHIIESALDLGANEWQVFTKIIMPLIFPAIISGWLLSFTLSLDDVVISFFVTGPTFEILPIKIYSLVRLGIKPEVNAMATCLLFFSVTMAIIAQKVLHKKPI